MSPSGIGPVIWPGICVKRRNDQRAARRPLGKREQEMGDRDVNDGPRIVVLIAGGALAHILVNRLAEHFGSFSA